MKTEMWGLGRLRLTSLAMRKKRDRWISKAVGGVFKMRYMALVEGRPPLQWRLC